MKYRITVFSIDITIKIPLRFFAFRHPVAAQLKAEVNGKNCTPLRFVAFALCARLLLKTLIIPRVRLDYEFPVFGKENEYKGYVTMYYPDTSRLRLLLNESDTT